MTASRNTALGEIATFIRGITFKPADLVEFGSLDSVVCLRTSNVQNRLSLDDVWTIPKRFVRRSDQILQEGDLLVSTANSWNLVGKSSHISTLPWPSTFGGFVSCLRPNCLKVHDRFLSYWFNSPQTQAELRACGRQTTNISNLDLNRALNLKIYLPPLPEQRRIAAILDQSDALRTKRRQTYKVIDILTRSVFLDLFGHPASNLRSPRLVPFEKVADIKLGKMLDEKKKTGLHVRPYLRNANVQWNKVDVTSLLTMDFDPAEREKFSLRKGDLLVCEGGEPGRAAIWNGEIEDCYFQKAVHRCRLDLSSATPEYFVYLFWFMSETGLFDGRISSATIKHLTAEKLRELQVPLPPLSAQKQFTERANKIKKTKLLYAGSQQSLDLLFASLQHRAFRAEV